MNTTKKITIKTPRGGQHVITYATQEQAENAAKILRQLNNMRKTIVPCDVMTGKTEKMANVEGYKATIE